MPSLDCPTTLITWQSPTSLVLASGSIINIAEPTSSLSLSLSLSLSPHSRHPISPRRCTRLLATSNMKRQFLAGNKSTTKQRQTGQPQQPARRRRHHPPGGQPNVQAEQVGGISDVDDEPSELLSRPGQDQASPLSAADSTSPQPAHSCVCPTCQQVFGRRAHLKRHMDTVHSQERRHVCKDCDRTFQRRDHLDKHQRQNCGKQPTKKPKRLPKRSKQPDDEPPTHTAPLPAQPQLFSDTHAHVAHDLDQTSASAPAEPVTVVVSEETQAMLDVLNGTDLSNLLSSLSSSYDSSGRSTSPSLPNSDRIHPGMESQGETALLLRDNPLSGDIYSQSSFLTEWRRQMRLHCDNKFQTAPILHSSSLSRPFANEAVTKGAARLMAEASAKINQRQSVDFQTSEMVRLAFEGDTLDKRRTAVKNCVVLARENAGARKLFHCDAPQRFMALLNEEDDDIRVHTLHVYSELAERSPAMALQIWQLMNQDNQLGQHVASKHSKTNRAAVRVVGCTLNALAEMGEASEQHSTVLDTVVAYLTQLIKDRRNQADVRNLAINMVMKHAKTGDLGRRLLTAGAVRALLVTAALAPSPLLAQPTGDSEDEQLGSEAETRGQVSVALQRIFEATKVKGQPDEQFVADCIAQARFGDDPVSNIPPTNAMIAVMLAVIDIGNQILESGNTFECLMKMADSDNLQAQCAAAEALAFAASDKKRARGVMMEGSDILKKLYAKDLPSSIRVRALCGLCKMGAVGAGAPNQRTMDGSSLINLAKKLRPFLVNDTKDNDTRRWAAEGLAYLSLDADVKEFAIADENILKAIYRVCMGSDPTVQYALANMLVNMTNSFDKPEKSEEHEELKKLGKYVGEQIPEPHAKDSDAFVQKRVEVLLKHDFVYALTVLAQSQSEGVREQVARVLLAMVENPSHRGMVISQGGAKALLPLARENTRRGKEKAAQALAKITITTDPSVAFPGQRALEVVKPCIALLSHMHQLLQFEAAMALTNLASMSDELRLKIKREKGLPRLEDLMFEDDLRLRRAGCEALVNLLYNDEIYNMFATKDGPHFERVKLWILLSGVMQEDFDEGLARAASGGLALLSSSPDVAHRIREEPQGLQVLKELLVSGMPELHHRALYIINNMIDADEAECFVEKEMLLIIVAVTLTSQQAQVTELGQSALKKLIDRKLVESMEAVQRMAAESIQDLQHVADRLKEEARARDGVVEEEDEDEEAGEAGGLSEDEGEADADGPTEVIVADAPDDDAVALPACDEDDGPKIEVLD
ncbi:uncharacterized protein MONBRDRAFT_34234 [Monosiga brevicollis MX1]|uniref:C2H2-type domain-containing protein n=1 Tax=Monosiga brevicollis TaxID=81824 RepID=A9VAE0_MONBE|nr:uncharacterized protein MONBRDRAFT_34234 [Monosiga brevicollis MX1]EDQ85525.1 predicted protein [Monosiga brevicollis MX1]|eukprot:XP_001749716.1 hypothetical protein [Monosiga brevicollis MX1]